MFVALLRCRFPVQISTFDQFTVKVKFGLFLDSSYQYLPTTPLLQRRVFDLTWLFPA